MDFHLVLLHITHTQLYPIVQTANYMATLSNYIIRKNLSILFIIAKIQL
jgi:hypothetical protein